MQNLVENDEEAMLIIPVNAHKERFMPGVSQNSGPMPVISAPNELRLSKT